MNNYIKTGWRNLKKDRFYSAIKILSLTIGVAVCLLIFLYVRYENSYDKNIPDKERIFRVVATQEEMKGLSFPAPFAAAVKDEIPGVEEVARINPGTLFTGGGNLVRRPDEAEDHYEENFTFADPEFLRMIGVNYVYGNEKDALEQPNSIVITKKIADKYFPGENPVGKTLIVGENESRPIPISGVIQDFPANSQFQYDFFITLRGMEFFPGEQTSWVNSNYLVFVKLKPGVDPHSLESKIVPIIFDKYAEKAMKADGADDASIKALREKLGIVFQPIADIHLNKLNIQDGEAAVADYKTVRLFSFVALFVLLLAVVNYVNLSTAKSVNRAREIGVRKAIGSLRFDLVRQFLTESFIFTFIAVLAAVLLAWILLPVLNQVAGRAIVFPWTELTLWLQLAALTLALSILSGLYPALYLSSFRPVAVLKGQLTQGKTNNLLRNGLVVFQFSISVALIISTIVVNSQLHFILNKNIGFNKDQVMLLQGTDMPAEKALVFRNRLAELPQVSSVTMSEYLPVKGISTQRNQNEMWEKGVDKNVRNAGVQVWQVDEDYIPTLGMKLVAGRNFDPSFPTDSAGMIVNQALVNQLQLKDPLNAVIQNGWTEYRILGVVEDFHYESMRENIGPVALKLEASTGITAIKLKSTDLKASIAAITKIAHEVNPHAPVQYHFLDEAFAKMYQDVTRQEALFQSFAILAILVACLGLFALASFLAEQRRKEIGIRKVLGASVFSVSKLLSTQFIVLVLLSILIASPLAWWAMNQWLQDFSYRIDISWWIFAIAALGSVIIAIITVSSQAIKAALMNPVKSLRSE